MDLLRAGIIASSATSAGLVGPRPYVIPEPVTFPPSKTLVGGQDKFLDLSAGQVVNVIGYDATPTTGFSLLVSSLAGDGSDVISWEASTDYATDGIDSGNILTVPGAVSARLRIDDGGVPALTHRAAVEILMPFSGTPYTINSLILDMFSLCRLPTINAGWEDTLRVTFGKATMDFNIQYTPGDLISGFADTEIRILPSLMYMSGGNKAIATFADQDATIHGGSMVLNHPAERMVAGDTAIVASAPNGADNGSYTVNSTYVNTTIIVNDFSVFVDVIFNDAVNWASTFSSVDTWFSSCSFAGGKRTVLSYGIPSDVINHIAAGDTITISGAPNPVNDGTYTIESVANFGDTICQIVTTDTNDWGSFALGAAGSSVNFVTSGALPGGYIDASFTYDTSGNLQIKMDRPRFNISYPANADAPSPIGRHEEDLWFHDIMALDPATPTVSVAEEVIDVFSTGGDNGVMASAAELDTDITTATSFPLKIERILSNPVSGTPSLCGTVDTYIGPINLTLDNV